MAENTCPQHRIIPPGAEELFSVDFQDALDSGVLLTGTPTVTEVDEDDDAVASSDLTITNAAVNTATLVIEGRDAEAGEAIQFFVTGQQNGSTYRLMMIASTDTTPAGKKPKYMYFTCENQ